MRLIDADVLKMKIIEERDAIPKTRTERYGFGVEFPNHHGESMRGGIRKALRCMEQTPTIDAVPVVRCKDCLNFMPKHILQNDGTRRAYTEQEKELPLGVTCDIGINCGSRCLRYLSWEKNRIPVFVQENDFCSYGERRADNATD